MQEEIFIRECGVTISQVVTASYYENIKGEMTLSFQVPTEQVQRVEVGQRLEFGRQYFDIVSMEQSIAEGRFLTTISAEQISLSLADEEYDLESFVFSGAAEDALDAILDDTDFYGYVSSNSGMHVEFNRTGTINRRALLQELCGKIQCELQYNGEMIELVSPEDSRGMIEVGDYPMIEFNISRTKEGTTYELVTNRFDELAVGATAYIELREPYNIFERSRVIALSYNPFYRKEIVVTMGDYQPDIIDEMVDDREETENIRDSLKDYVTNDIFDDKVSSSIDTYINSEGGKSSLVHSLKGEYVTTDEATGFVTKQNVSAEIAAYVDSKAGTAQITQKLEGTFLKEDSLGNYVQKTSLSTEIGSYIDTKEGTAKIISAASGTYQTKSGMSDYAKVTAVTEIEQAVSEVESSITLSSSYAKNTIGTNVYALLQLVSNANSSSIKLKADKIDFTGFTTFLRASDLGASGSTTIDGGRIKTGTISADRIDVSTIKVDRIYGNGSYKSTQLLSVDGIKMYIGGTTTATTSNQIYITASSQIDIGAKTTGVRYDVSANNFRPIASGTDLGGSMYAYGDTYIGVNSSGYHWKIVDTCITPSTSSYTSGSFYIGSSLYPIGALHTKELYVNGKKLEAGSSSGSTSANFSNQAVSLGGSSSYYIVASTGREFRPNSTSTSYPFYLGSSTYYWHYAYIGSTETRIGNSASSKLGFFGTTPAARQTVSSSATVAQLITALKAYGLIY